MLRWCASEMVELSMLYAITFFLIFSFALSMFRPFPQPISLTVYLTIINKGDISLNSDWLEPGTAQTPDLRAHSMQQLPQHGASATSFGSFSTSSHQLTGSALLRTLSVNLFLVFI